MTFFFIVCFLVLLAYIVLLIYYRAAWQSIPEFSLPDSYKGFSTRITVIIPARNEAGNLPTLLESLSAQSYPKELFEVLVIDDHSTDDSAAIVKNFRADNMKLLSLKDHLSAEINSYKKKAIEIGIQQSTGSLIVTTDADCYVPPHWLRTIAAFYEKEKPAFIAAPVAINCGLRFIEIFQALDFMTLQGITGASVYKKMHSMCNGANMAYEKAAFYEVGGFTGIDAIASGDDMLLMHKIFNRHPNRVSFLRSKDAIAQTQPVKTVGQFLNQRIRWASKADKYDDKRIFSVLLLVYILNVLLVILPFIAIFYPKYSIFHIQCSLWLFWALMLLAKTIAELFFLYPVSKFFHKQSLLFLFPIMQPFHIVYTVVAGWLGKFGNYQWKERKVK